MLRRRGGRAAAILVSFAVLAVAIWFGTVCFRYDHVLYGSVIVLSFAVIFVCVLLLCIKSVMDAEHVLYRDVGLEKTRVACSCDYRDVESADGELVLYDKGLTYESGGEELVGFLPYRKVSHAVLDGQAVMLFVPAGMRVRVMTVEAGSVLRAKAILMDVGAAGVEVREV